MKASELRKLIREEVEKALNENYRAPKDNLMVVIEFLKKGHSKDALAILEQVLGMVENGETLDNAFDEAIEMHFDTGGGMYKSTNPR
jgi:hypothetical protein